MSYGLKASEFREILKDFHSQFLELSFQEKMDLVVKFLQEGIGELGHVGLYIITLCLKDLEPKHFPFLDSLPQYFQSWSYVDHIALGVMQPLLWK